MMDIMQLINWTLDDSAVFWSSSPGDHSSVQMKLLDELCQTEHITQAGVHVHGDVFIQIVGAAALRAGDGGIVWGWLQPTSIFFNRYHHHRIQHKIFQKLYF